MRMLTLSLSTELRAPEGFFQLDPSEMPLGFPALFSEELADGLMELTKSEARYDPAENPGGKKGWEISIARMGRDTIVIAWATWIT